MFEAGNWIEIGLSSAIFVGLWMLLSRTFFGPYISMLTERQARTVGDEKAILQKREEVVTAQAKIDGILMHTRLAGINERDEMLGDAKRQAQELVIAASQKAQERLEASRSTLRQNIQSALFDLERDSDQLADLVVQRVTDPSSSPAVH